VEPTTAIVLAGGDEKPPDPPQVPSPAVVIAADSGYEAAHALGLSVDLLVGDLDSLSPAALAAARASGIPVDEHPADKDATDLELALRAAIGLRPVEIVVIGGLGGRLDHLLGNAMLLGASFLGDVPVRWEGAGVTGHRVIPAGGCRVTGSPGDLVSLLPIGGPAGGVVTHGLRWRLEDETIPFGSTRGLSNRLTGTKARVSIGSGVLLVIHERSGHS
jgi:thiamine pyrophosphokinase